LSGEERAILIEHIVQAPVKLRAAAARLSSDELDTPYRKGGWTARQVIHHVPDSHMNAFIRFKLALTEDQPTIRPYDEAAWAELADAKSADIETSLVLLETVTRRWERVLRSMNDADFSRKLLHPEIGVVDLDHMLELYGWHSRHHVGHVLSIRP
jgi:uncharacterized damage-inducible protein DinB